jgi:outer membrane protein assembly factor BamE (lipoprotein component of BamABCDE complex)
VVLSWYYGFFHHKTGRHDIAESGVKHNKSNQRNLPSIFVKKKVVVSLGNFQSQE